MEIVREAWDASLRRDVDGMFAYFDPEVVWDMTHFREWPDVTYRGGEGVRRFLDEWLEVWDEYEVAVDELILAAPDGRVVGLAWQRGKGRRSGLPMEMEWASITALRDGKIIRIDNYDDRSKALEAAGLSALATRRRGRLARGPDLSQLPGPGEHSVQHRLGQPAGEGVLLATGGSSRPARSGRRAPPRRGRSAASGAGSRAPAPERPQGAIPGEAAQGDDHLRSLQQPQLLDQVRAGSCRAPSGVGRLPAAGSG